MSYKVNFTDTTIHPDPIEVADNTTNVDTSIKLPGRNQTGYGQIIAENFLHLLETETHRASMISDAEIKEI